MMTPLQKIQNLLLRVPAGKVTTYAEIARAIGMPKAHRTIGTLCGKNDDTETYPCYKVARSDGKVGGYVLGVAEKIRRLKKDGVEVEKGRIKNFKTVMFRFTGQKFNFSK